MSYGRALHRAVQRFRDRIRAQRERAHRQYLIRRRNECEKKLRYDKQWFAEEVARKCEAARGVPLTVYQCPHCQGWHLTHVTKARGEP